MCHEHVHTFYVCHSIFYNNINDVNNLIILLKKVDLTWLHK